MAATRKSIRLSSLMKSPQLLFTTIALSSSRGGISVRFVESFSITSYNINHHNHNQQQRRCVHLPARSSNSESRGLSVTGPIYDMKGVTTVKLFTKEGCTLCDKVKDVLESVREDQPHSLYAVDITDDDKQDWFDKYKYDIPVLHINDIYWTKHRLSAEDAIAAIDEANRGDFTLREGEPDASRLEHN